MHKVSLSGILNVIAGDYSAITVNSAVLSCPS
nr:MAG TPA: hypothetical protein [Caudoviricetes sp.]